MKDEGGRMKVNVFHQFYNFLWAYLPNQDNIEKEALYINAFQDEGLRMKDESSGILPDLI